MSRFGNHHGPGKERKLLTRAIVVAIRQLARQNEIIHETKDLLSFIIMSLESISKSVERSVYAWEKRDYWLKADRFRLDWSWAGDCSKSLRTAYNNNDLVAITKIIAEISQKLNNVKVSNRNRIGTPWKGCSNLFD